MSHLSFACLFSKISHVVKMAWEKRGCCGAAPRRQAAARLESIPGKPRSQLTSRPAAPGHTGHSASLTNSLSHPWGWAGQRDTSTARDTNSAPRLWPLPHSPAPVPRAFAPGAAGISDCWSHPSSCHLLEPTWTLQVLAPKCSSPQSQASCWHGTHSPTGRV